MLLTVLGTIEFPSGVSGFTNFTEQTAAVGGHLEDEDESEFQEFDLEEDDSRTKRILQPGLKTKNFFFVKSDWPINYDTIVVWD